MKREYTAFPRFTHPAIRITIGLMLPDSSVLVAVMNSPRDFALAREAHWYRIPQKTAPKFFPPDFVAFYCTKPFGEDAYSVRWYAQVRGHELLKRSDLLPDEAHHPRAGEPYYKLQLGPLLELPHAIPSKRWRRLTFVLTTGERLFSAWEINDLILGPHEHDLMWRALKEAGIAAERGYVIREAKARYNVDLAVPCARGMIGIVIRERKPRHSSEIVLHFTPRQVNEHLAECVRQVKQAVLNQGGAK
jgi:hypothetical protein